MSRNKEKAQIKAAAKDVQDIYKADALDREIKSTEEALKDAQSKGNFEDIQFYTNKLNELKSQLETTPTKEQALENVETAMKEAGEKYDTEQAERGIEKGGSRQSDLYRASEVARDVLADSDLPYKEEGIKAASNQMQKQAEKAEQRTGADLSQLKSEQVEKTEQALAKQPVEPEAPTQYDFSGDVDTQKSDMEVNDTNEQAESIIDAALEGAKEKVEEDNFIEAESADLDKIRDLYKDIPDYTVEGVPTSILNAYKSGLLGEVGSKDAKSARNQLILDSILTAIANAANTYQGKETEQSLWGSKTAKDWEESTARKNEKLRTQMEQQLNLSNLSAEDQEKARAAIKSLSTDAYFTRAAQQLNNVEDVLGLFELKKAVGNQWSNMNKTDRQNILAAYQLVASGDVNAAQNAVNSLPKDKQEQVGKALLESQIEQAKNNSLLTREQYNMLKKSVEMYDWTMGMQMLSSVLGNIGNVGSIVK